jgi:hypothetical protein
MDRRPARDRLQLLNPEEGLEMETIRTAIAHASSYLAEHPEAATRHEQGGQDRLGGSSLA